MASFHILTLNIPIFRTYLRLYARLQLACFIYENLLLKIYLDHIPFISKLQLNNRR